MAARPCCGLEDDRLISDQNSQWNIHKRGNKKKQDDDEDARSPYAIYIVGFLIVLLVGGVVVEATMRLF
nr:hypothetical protein HK105_007206 [Polyrhizophydium stewartii]